MLSFSTNSTNQSQTSSITLTFHWNWANVLWYKAHLNVQYVARTQTTQVFECKRAGFIAGSIHTNGIEYFDLSIFMAAAVAVLHAITIKSQFNWLIKKLVNFLHLSCSSSGDFLQYGQYAESAM